jgi:hypothetical protein
MKTAIGVKLAVLLHRLWVSGEVYEPLRNSQKAMNESRTPNWHRAKIAHIRVRMEGWRQRRLGWVGTDSRKEESESATGWRASLLDDPGVKFFYGKLGE